MSSNDKGREFKVIKVRPEVHAKAKREAKKRGTHLYHYASDMLANSIELQTHALGDA